MYGTGAAGSPAFWYERPALNEQAFHGGAGYFMKFRGKAAYPGPFDAQGIPLLDYQGDIGRQYNPIAIAQYGLARYNRWIDFDRAREDEKAWRTVAEWLATHMRPNAAGVPVWMLDFDWQYRQLLKAPWYSGLAQGNGLSMLVRATRATGDRGFGDAAHVAFGPFLLDVSKGGVLSSDEQGDVWIEEYIVDPPSHILNGFMWALWGVDDYAQWSGCDEAHKLWAAGVRTLERRLHEFDTGWWSLYEARHNGRRMVASRYDHALHITQLQVMHRLTGNPLFAATASRFQSYMGRRANRVRAFAEAAVFKLCHY